MSLIIEAIPVTVHQPIKDGAGCGDAKMSRSKPLIVDNPLKRANPDKMPYDWYNCPVPMLETKVVEFVHTRLTMFRETDVAWFKRLLEDIAEAADDTHQAVLHVIAIACPIFDTDFNLKVIPTEKDSGRAQTHMQIIRYLSKFLAEYDIELHVHLNVSNVQPLAYALALDAIVTQTRRYLEAGDFDHPPDTVINDLAIEIAHAAMPDSDPRFNNFVKFLKDYILTKAWNEWNKKVKPADVNSITEMSTRNTIEALQDGLSAQEQAAVTIIEHGDHMADVLEAPNRNSIDSLTQLKMLMAKLAAIHCISWDGDSEDDYDANSFLNALYVIDMAETVAHWVTVSDTEGVVWMNLMDGNGRQASHIDTMLNGTDIKGMVEYPVIRDVGRKKATT